MLIVIGVFLWFFFNNILGKCICYLVQGLGYNWRQKRCRTDTNVFMTIFGSDGESGEQKLENSGNNFDCNQTDALVLIVLQDGSASLQAQMPTYIFLSMVLMETLVFVF